MTFNLYFAGAENATWRNMLKASGAPMAASYFPMNTKSNGHKPRKSAREFFGTPHVLLDGGGLTASKLSGDALSTYADAFQSYVEDNAGDIEIVVELDPSTMSAAEREARRTECYDLLPPGKFFPAWRSEDGVETLRRLGRRYGAVAVASVVHQDRSLVPLLNAMAREGVLIHASGISDAAKLRAVRFSSASSLTWIAPWKFGALHVWDGRKLRLFSKQEVPRALQVMADPIARSTVDPGLVAAGDKAESVRLALWSWTQWAANFDTVSRSVRPLDNPFTVSAPEDDTEDDKDDLSSNTVTGLVVTAPGDEEAPGAVIDLGERRRKAARADHPSMSGVTQLREVSPVERVEAVLMPGLAQFLPVDPETGRQIGLGVPSLKRASLRSCDGCYLSAKCPEFRPASTCAFDFPVDMSSAAGAAAVRTAVAAAETNRIAFALMMEQMLGGEMDPNVSKELDRFWAHQKVKDEIDNPKVTMKQEFSAPSGILAQLMAGAPQAARVIEVEQ